ncbi:hypothetical protein B0H63DRAFT_542552 [Podospora didyma]|uniref:Uncharacterized protein n=1 Tax=Podospora didyma TaxID=330526 RepID=A0AAE0U1Y3_9PEZI|nr:hypothetical protein B0H63DRAFT_542552 [Podospora didyma]
MSSYAITGASRGLGREFVRQFCQNPFNIVFALVRSPDSATKLKELSQENTNIHIIKADVTNPQSMIDAAAQISAISGDKLDVLIHNAVAYNQASAHLTPSQIPLDEEATHQMFGDALSTSLYGMIWATNAFLPLIENGTSKKIIHLSTALVDQDVTKKVGMAQQVDYVVGKAALNVLVAKYAVELESKGIKMLAIAPGWVDTYDGPLPKPTELEAMNAEILRRFQKADPNFGAGQLTMEDSVRMQLEVIAGLDMEQSGTFVSHHGDQSWSQ